jgi:hypothetical protein
VEEVKKAVGNEQLAHDSGPAAAPAVGGSSKETPADQALSQLQRRLGQRALRLLDVSTHAASSMFISSVGFELPSSWKWVHEKRVILQTESDTGVSVQLLVNPLRGGGSRQLSVVLQQQVQEGLSDATKKKKQEQQLELTALRWADRVVRAFYALKAGN